MPFQPKVDDVLCIDGTSYRITEHPTFSGHPYAQEGRQGIVYQLASGDDRRALKVFKAMYRVPALVSLADRLARFAELPGLKVCRRTVLSATQHGELLQQHTDLTYAVLMPWVDGPTWMNVVLLRHPLSPEQSLLLARSLARTLTHMEERNLAHCDLSGQNLLLPALARVTAHTKLLGLLSPDLQRTFRGGPLSGHSDDVALVDMEGLYGPGLDHPRDIISGSAGYAHKTVGQGVWAPEADRFAGAVLLVEMLGWHDERVRELAWGDSYFDVQEPQQFCERFRLLREVLRPYGSKLVGLFEQAWFSESLLQCPTFGEWAVSLPPEKAVELSPTSAAQAVPPPPLPRASKRPLPPWAWILAVVAIAAALWIEWPRRAATPVPAVSPSSLPSNTTAPATQPASAAHAPTLTTLPSIAAQPTVTAQPMATPAPVASAEAHTPSADRVKPVQVRYLQQGRSGFRQVDLSGLSYSNGQLDLWGNIRMPDGHFADQYWRVAWVGDDMVSGFDLDVTDPKIAWSLVTGRYRNTDVQGVLEAWQPSQATRCMVWIRLEAKAGAITEFAFAKFNLRSVLPGCVK
jgi:hypothetical protein